MIQIERSDVNGDLLEVIQDYTSLATVRTANAVGGLEATMPYEGQTEDSYAKNQLLEVAGGGQVYNDTVYLLQDWAFHKNEQGEKFVSLFAVDINYLLKSRIVGYPAASAEAYKIGKADDVMKAIVRENFNAPDRNVAGFTVTDDVSEGEDIEKGFAWRNVLTVLQEIADTATQAGTQTNFDVVRKSKTEFEFDTFIGQRGVDRGVGSDLRVLVGEQYGNLKKPRVSFSYSSEVNYVYGGGQGEEADRLIVELADDDRIAYGSPYNRIEAFADARHMETTDGVAASARRVLREGAPVKLIYGELVESDNFKYGIDFGFGDRLSVEAFGHVVDCAITAVVLKATPQTGLTVDVRLRGEM